MMQSDGSDLMLRFVQGDDRAFEPLLERYETEMLSFFLRLTGERQKAEDMVQELFLKVFRYRKTYKPKSSFRYFIYRMARNMWIDLYRKRKVRPRTLSLDAPMENDPRDANPSSRIESREPGPTHGAEVKEEVGRLEAAVARLPAKQREVIALAFEGGLRYAEIAKIMKVPIGTIKSRMHAAVKQLKRLMGED